MVLNKPIYVLIGSHTVSAAEEFAYNLKNLQRATLIGKTTAGGAHPTEVLWIHPHIEAYIPAWRALNPIPGTNWEGTGVAPDIDVSEEHALDTAYAHALEAIAAKRLLQEIRAARTTL